MIAATNHLLQPSRVSKRIRITLKNSIGGTLRVETKEVHAFPDAMQDMVAGTAADAIAGWYLGIGDTIAITEAA